MRDEELEAVLIDLGQHLAYPRPHLANAVRARVVASPRRRAWNLRALLPALATVALLVVVVSFGSPEVRAMARDILRIGGIEIYQTPSAPSLSPSPSATPLIPGQHMTLDDARRAVSFAVRAPVALGTPDDVVVETGPLQRVTLVYRSRPGIPTSRAAGVAALVVEFAGSVEPAYFGKVTGPDTTVQEVTVNGAPGYWIEGAPHLFFYRDAAGSVRDETLRLAGNTLIWVDAGVTYRLEAEVAKDAALSLAAGTR